MNTTSVHKFGARLALAVAFFASTAVMTHAQTLIKGQFNMPVQAQWGQLVLTPGHYTLEITRSAGGASVLRLAGPGGMQTRLLSAFSTSKPQEKSYLKLERIGGSYAVREFGVGPSGTTYTFRAPKALAIEAKNEAPVTGNPHIAMVAINAH